VNRRELLLGTLAAPLVAAASSAAGDAPPGRGEDVQFLWDKRPSDPRPWKPKWKETIFYSGGNVMGIEPRYRVGETVMIGGEVWWVRSVTRVKDRFVSDGNTKFMPLDQVLIRARNV
jgi:hypothetical protein